jgi:hypothetical protein
MHFFAAEICALKKKMVLTSGGDEVDQVPDILKPRRGVEPQIVISNGHEVWFHET